MDVWQQPSPSDTSTAIEYETIAVALVDAFSRRRFLPPPSRTRANFSKADALAISERIRALRIATGARPIGYKVGFTNAAVRAQFGAEGPLAAPIYDQTLAAEPRIDASVLLGPRIEPEVVIGRGADGEIAWAALGFEIVQSHFPNWEFGYFDAIADFGLHAALVVGERHPIRSAHELQRLTAMSVQLSRNGDIVERGAGSDVEGGAPGSLRWLHDDLRRVGRTLLPGEIVSTGSMTRVPQIRSGERWTIEALDNTLPALTIDVD